MSMDAADLKKLAVLARQKGIDQKNQAIAIEWFAQAYRFAELAEAWEESEDAGT